ncbi:hypothetical protein ASO14_271 [Kurthia sp. 11kri321]|nr:hypothetical protein ASO14_271 [Kurthia sp. 11kri321]
MTRSLKPCPRKAFFEAEFDLNEQIPYDFEKSYGICYVENTFVSGAFSNTNEKLNNMLDFNILNTFEEMTLFEPV